MMKQLQKKIREWQTRTFGPSSGHVWGLLKHFQSEASELRYAIFTRRKNEIREELADCVILLVGLADAHNIDLDAAVKAKMKKNEKRKWKKPDKNGVIEHVRN